MLHLEPNQIELGKQYQYEEKYYCIATVTVLEDESGKDDKSWHSDTWVGWKLRVDEDLGGMIKMEVGHEFSCGYDSKCPWYSDIKFKPVGSTPDYKKLR